MNQERREFITTALTTVVAGRFGLIQSRSDSGTLKQIDAGVLNVGYAEVGPANGRVVLLLHGWPYDIHAFDEVAPLLAGKGYRVVAPYLRGYGTTRFLSSDAVRNGQPAALAVDAVAFMDALKIDKPIIAGFGGNGRHLVAALWPGGARRWFPSAGI
jgi:pimeloyl-ACP methyl ester carboxylesterase